MRIDLFWNNLSQSIVRGSSYGAFLLPLLFAACANENLDQSQELGPLRILALKASTPEVTIGTASTSITPWVSDFTHGGDAGRSWSFSWATCPDPGIPYGAEPRCDASTIIQQGSGTIAAGTLLAANAYTSPLPAITITIPNATTSFWTNRNAISQSNGVPLIFQFTLNAGSETTTGFRRILVTSKVIGLNSNPNLTDITVDGASIAGGGGSLPLVEKEILPVLGGGSQESYSLITTNGTILSKNESLTVSWFTTAGEFQFDRTDTSTSNTWTPPSSGTPRAILFLRDDRGGVSDPLSIGF